MTREGALTSYTNAEAQLRKTQSDFANPYVQWRSMPSVHGKKVVEDDIIGWARVWRRSGYTHCHHKA